jgi:hypothetical protein
LPLSVQIAVPVAELIDTGVKSTMEQRPHSLFATLSSMSPGVVDLFAKPFVDGQGESLAQTLAEEYGDRVKYLSMYGPAFIRYDLEHGELMDRVTHPTRDSPDMGSLELRFEPIFYSLVVLRQCLHAYVSQIPSLGVDDEALAANLARSAVGFLGDDYITYLGRVPLAGLDVAGQGVSVADCSVVPLTPEELGYLNRRRHNFMYQAMSPVSSLLPGEFPRDLGIQEAVTLEVRARRPKSEVFHDIGPRCQKVLLALHLCGLAYGGAGFGAMVRQPQWLWAGGQSFYPLLMPHTQIQTRASLSPERLATVPPFAGDPGPVWD